ncbi:hypothetical protein [uncultured Ramlibacter sp.]|nr:hypothetical protein [uncultured Ramlibacter sp.]
MAKAFPVVLFLLVGCTGAQYRPDTSSPCYASEASYECQIERYLNVNAN